MEAEPGNQLVSWFISALFLLELGHFEEHELLSHVSQLLVECVYFDIEVPIFFFCWTLSNLD